RLPQLDVLVLDVADLADRRAAGDEDLALLSGGELHLRVVALFGHELGRAAGAPDELAPLPLLELDVVDHRAEGDVTKGQRGARLYVRARSRHDGVADLQTDRREDVGLLAVRIVEKREPRGPIRIVLDGRDA